MNTGRADTENEWKKEKGWKYFENHAICALSKLTDTRLICFFTGDVDDFKFKPNCDRSGELFMPFECSALPFVWWWCGLFSLRSYKLSFDSLLYDFLRPFDRLPFALDWFPPYVLAECAKPFTLYEILVAVSSIIGDFIGDISRNSDNESESPSMLIAWICMLVDWFDWIKNRQAETKSISSMFINKCHLDCECVRM